MRGQDYEAASFLQTLNLKTTLFNGFDKAAVFAAMRGLADVYEAAIARERGARFAQTQALRAHVHEAVNMRNEGLFMRAQLEKQAADARAEVFAARGEADRLRKHMELGYRQIDAECAMIIAEAENEARRISGEARAAILPAREGE